MKRVLKISGILIVIASAFLTSCFSDYPMDEDGLLISFRTSTAILSLNLLDENHQTVVHTIPNDLTESKKRNPFIDTLDHCVVRVIVRWKADVKKLWPQFTLADDCKLEPKVRAFTDFTQPLEYTVISGNRKRSKKYKVYVIRQDPADPDNHNPQTDNPWYDYFEDIYATLPE